MAQKNQRGRYITFGSANEANVRELTQELAQAWEAILHKWQEEHEGQTVAYMDGCMAVHNFHRVAIQHVIDDCGLSTVEALGFMRMMSDTFVQAIQRDRGQLSAHAEGRKGPRD